MKLIVLICTPSGWAAHDCELTNRKTKTWVFPFKTEEVHTYTRVRVFVKLFWLHCLSQPVCCSYLGMYVGQNSMRFRACIRTYNIGASYSLLMVPISWTYNAFCPYMEKVKKMHNSCLFLHFIRHFIRQSDYEWSGGLNCMVKVT